MQIRRRPELLPPSALPDHLHPVVRQVLTRRPLKSADELEYSLDKLLNWDGLNGIEPACERLETALREQQRILIVGDFDADGATASALSVLALKSMGAENVDYLVPDRFKFGYGLTPEIVAVAREGHPDLIITVDNGIASVDGVASANAASIDVIVTDHHLPGKDLPAALAIINPNNREDGYPSKALCGCGVVFYLLLALRARLTKNNWFEEQNLTPPNMAQYLDLVALGTVADVVPLDYNNRIMIQAGIERIRAGACRPGITAIIRLANRTVENLSSTDLGFAIGPRLNAAGRLQDMSVGIECLLTDDPAHALKLARELDSLNRDRREIEADMQASAVQAIEALELDPTDLPSGLCLYDADWHSGVVGLLASRLKDRYHRPVIAFARDEGSEQMKGSARSIKGLHIRDALDRLATENPGLIDRFGGHAMAAGLSLPKAQFSCFKAAWESLCDEILDADMLTEETPSDGELDPELLNIESAEALFEAGPWGQLFEAPVFDGRFSVKSTRIVGEQHLKLSLQPPGDGPALDAIAFFYDDAIPDRGALIRACYQLEVNEYQGRRSAQLIIRGLSLLD